MSDRMPEYSQIGMPGNMSNRTSEHISISFSKYIQIWCQTEYRVYFQIYLATVGIKRSNALVHIVFSSCAWNSMNHELSMISHDASMMFPSFQPRCATTACLRLEAISSRQQNSQRRKAPTRGTPRPMGFPHRNIRRGEPWGTEWNTCRVRGNGTSC